MLTSTCLPAHAGAASSTASLLSAIDACVLKAVFWALLCRTLSANAGARLSASCAERRLAMKKDCSKAMLRTVPRIIAANCTAMLSSCPADGNFCDNEERWANGIWGTWGKNLANMRRICDSLASPTSWITSTRLSGFVVLVNKSNGTLGHVPTLVG